MIIIIKRNAHCHKSVTEQLLLLDNNYLNNWLLINAIQCEKNNINHLGIASKSRIKK